MRTNTEWYNGLISRGLAPTNFEARPIVSLSEKQASQYSVVAALDWLIADHVAGDCSFEKEVSDEIQKRTNRLPSSGRSIFLPTQLAERAGLDTLSGAAGGYAVTSKVPPEMIEMLRAQTRIFALGAQLLPGLRENVSFLVEQAATAASWQSEDGGTDNADVTQSFFAGTLSPHPLIGNTSFTRKLLRQSSVPIETMVRKDLTRSLAIALDAGAIAGSGPPQPTGILNTTGVGVVSIGANGGAPTLATILSMEQVLGDANVDERGIGFLTTPDIRHTLRGTFKNAASLPVWDDGGLLDYPAMVSKNVPQNLTKGSGTGLNAVIAGNFSDLVVGEWGSIELIVDPYRLKKKAVIEIAVFGLFDVLIRRPASFVACVDAVAS